MNGKDIEQSGDVPRIIGEMRPGDSATLKVWRKGAARDMRVTIGEAPQEKVASAQDAAQQEGGKLGLALRQLTPDERKETKTDGLVVEGVTGPAAEAGIRQGDVLLAFNGEKVTSVDQLRQLVGKAKGKAAVLVQREDARLYIPIKIG